MKERCMKRKREFQILTVVAILAILGAYTTYALLYLQTNVDFSSGVSTIGSIGIYEDAGCTTSLVSYDFSLFSSAPTEVFKDAYIRNECNTPCTVYWNMSASSLTWTLSGLGEGYKHEKATVVVYRHQIIEDDTTKWYPDETDPEGILLQPDEVVHVSIKLQCDDISTSETFTWTDTFYAKDT